MLAPFALGWAGVIALLSQAKALVGLIGAEGGRPVQGAVVAALGEVPGWVYPIIACLGFAVLQSMHTAKLLREEFAKLDELREKFDSLPEVIAARALPQTSVVIGSKNVTAAELLLDYGWEYGGDMMNLGALGSFIERDYGLERKKGYGPACQFRQRLVVLKLLHGIELPWGDGTHEADKLTDLGTKTLALLVSVSGDY